ncbi:hypothetical protein [Clostridium folliculivorans]|uniref:Uncharacterized protein n=1 Tax=Clostridium folliculivorans TaxID=2886038 RepID=A0A9W5Y542_9CLOT|nr:hypothetical protein [Clostridium folliculivorans]GKU26818.1 hypothetical protein CFOLD11_36450 [Clostridium folliculivorans]GKU31412.1 hypothetical protein CFB3_35190 [Clostridium folliculivorans]
MKDRKNKWLKKYNEESYAALTKYFASYFQAYFPYYWGWMSSFHDTEASVASDLSNETKERSYKTK